MATYRGRAFIVLHVHYIFKGHLSSGAITSRRRRLAPIAHTPDHTPPPRSWHTRTLIARDGIDPRAIRTRQVTCSPTTRLITSTSQLLSERRPLPEHGAFPVDDVHRDDQQERDAEQDGGCVGERVRADVLEEWCSR